MYTPKIDSSAKSPRGFHAFNIINPNLSIKYLSFRVLAVVVINAF